MSLQEAAEARKAKLAALKKRKTLHDSGNPEAAADANDKPEVFRFRNYDPETGTARKHARTDENETVEKQVEGLAEKIIAEDEAKRAQELDLTNIQPKRANWDLKRDLDRKLSKLKTKTDIAISQLIRKRLQAQKGGDAAAASLVAGFEGAGGQELPEADSDDE
ncbi:cwf18 pre-mRNA splicing factor-domain-containing protein [Leucosporidium creatinivorum]|uniref:Cwf18 pre-mRNA splicing factor-domain-containing protein n=1 Tax=Leucosporidium creatinivorum TaxID=106004 RepID=A0A1Y2EM00_9BASI|nr:cwf18 pre-mRNA splicing factor-domain-containing protein [Leucosporidium creatinivorum]